MPGARMDRGSGRLRDRQRVRSLGERETMDQVWRRVWQQRKRWGRGLLAAALLGWLTVPGFAARSAAGARAASAEAGGRGAYRGAAVGTTGSTAGSIPEVHGMTFSGDAVDLPKMLSGKVAVLVIGFSRDSREPVAAWGRRLAAEYKGSGAVVYYEMPMLAEVPRMLRGVVLRSMRKEVPERAQPRFVPLTEDEARWKDLVGYGRPEDAYVVVLDGAGKVSGREHGPATEASFAEVKAKVASAEVHSVSARP